MNIGQKSGAYAKHSVFDVSVVDPVVVHDEFVILKQGFKRADLHADVESVFLTGPSGNRTSFCHFRLSNASKSSWKINVRSHNFWPSTFVDRSSGQSALLLRRTPKKTRKRHDPNNVLTHVIINQTEYLDRKRRKPKSNMRKIWSSNKNTTSSSYRRHRSNDLIRSEMWRSWPNTDLESGFFFLISYGYDRRNSYEIYEKGVKKIIKLINDYGCMVKSILYFCKALRLKVKIFKFKLFRLVALGCRSAVILQAEEKEGLFMPTSTTWAWAESMYDSVSLFVINRR